MLEKTNKKYFEEVYEILCDSFPESERRTYEEQKKLLENPKYSLYTISENDKLKGFFSVWELEEFMFVEHFAIHKKSRDKGLGGKYLKKLISLLNSQVILEVEPPKTLISKKRIEFYKRNGFIYNDYQYFQPPLGKNKRELPLKILSYPKKLKPEEFENIKNILYKTIYKV